MSDSVTRLDLGSYLRLALGNLGRNRRRTLITLSSLILGIACLTFLGALNDGWLRQMKDNFILSLTGHIQVHARGFEISQSIEDLMDDPQPVIRRVAGQPGVRAWTLRLRTSGLASTAEANAGIQIMAIDPVREPGVTHIAHCLSSGHTLSPGNARELLLGSTLAENLGAAPGERVVLMAQRPDGNMASEVFHVRGILCPGAPQVDRTLGLISLQAAARWLGTGQAVSDLVVRLDRHAATEEVFQRLSRDLSGARYEVMRWQDLDPVVRQWLDFSQAYSLVVILVVVALVVVEILNTMLMAIHERYRELGVMEALGTRTHQLFGMVLLEGILLVFSGAFLGYLAGAVAVFQFSRNGIDLSGFSDAFTFFYMSPVIRPILTTDTELQIVGTTLATALLAGLYPAWRATRVRVEQALRIT